MRASLILNHSIGQTVWTFCDSITWYSRCDLKHKVALSACFMLQLQDLRGSVSAWPPLWSESTFCTIFLVVRMDSGRYSEARGGEPTIGITGGLRNL